ncbi:Acetylornithine deacetylase [Alloactinosynnema sp. L-07]|uniref:M20/M25/M40 family metallo-hydrolase n=1 Tax=Alloactinosynnema sp. L-07 TaxID=1653480 RepID=UPI00065EF037|nr:M20/M25/M40 family metallo-hydrolase [Alloactinosynnema sp. L-07]CRK59495.1 Acetylornithine deacetylase [Alloactinosynnema sp. L-07]
MTQLTSADHALLLRLLALPTAGPLETDEPARLWDAQFAYADSATGFKVLHHAPADLSDVRRPDVPAPVRAAAREPGFLDGQPSLVLSLGPRRPRERTVMFNVHLDTVAGQEPVSFDGVAFRGRGAIDAKGPAVALLAGIRDSAARDARVGDEVSVLVQAVAGEEGGAMGTFGTRPLVERGYVGALNIFCEPTGLRYLPRATASATAAVRVAGHGAIDDRPGDGHNATVLLGFLAQHLAGELVGDADGHACVAGLHTGTAHNRVYGSGDLLINLAYATPAAGARLAGTLDRAVGDGLDRFAKLFAHLPEFALTAAEAHRVTTVDWLKHGLPTLDTRSAELDAWMRAAAIPRWPADEPAFTCDAIWLADVPGTATAVLGPGDLAANNAHAEGEFATLTELTAFAEQVSRLLRAFADAPPALPQNARPTRENTRPTHQNAAPTRPGGLPCSSLPAAEDQQGWPPLAVDDSTPCGQPADAPPRTDSR